MSSRNVTFYDLTKENQTSQADAMADLADAVRDATNVMLGLALRLPAAGAA